MCRAYAMILEKGHAFGITISHPIPSRSLIFSDMDLPTVLGK